MDGQFATAIISLSGVVLGGGFSWLVQSSTQRMSARTEQRRQDVARADARRAERLTCLERFVAVAADAERLAFERPADWAPGDSWPRAAQEAMKQLWVAGSMLQVLFPPDVHSSARVYFQRINRAVWDGVPDLEALYPALDDLRDAFLAAARSALD
ncbi:hypothetical protein ACN27B_03030 [Micromonospora sp. WMMD754]|uniref:hypothetical protein n=1 Tax=Micromonospora sp. WMMD754 TaxID=3404114 RepID=UPI003BF4BA27